MTNITSLNTYHPRHVIHVIIFQKFQCPILVSFDHWDTSWPVDLMYAPGMRWCYCSQSVGDEVSGCNQILRDKIILSQLQKMLFARPPGTSNRLPFSMDLWTSVHFGKDWGTMGQTLPTNLSFGITMAKIFKECFCCMLLIMDILWESLSQCRRVLWIPCV